MVHPRSRGIRAPSLIPYSRFGVMFIALGVPFDVKEWKPAWTEQTATCVSLETCTSQIKADPLLQPSPTTTSLYSPLALPRRTKYYRSLPFVCSSKPSQAPVVLYNPMKSQMLFGRLRSWCGPVAANHFELGRRVPPSLLLF